MCYFCLSACVCVCCYLLQHTMYGANVVVFEGIMAFCHAPLLKLMDLKIFVDTDSDIRLARRLAIVKYSDVYAVCMHDCNVRDVFRLSSLLFALFLSRLRRDIAERGRDLEGVLKQYNKFVKPVSPLPLSTISRKKQSNLRKRTIGSGPY